MNSHYSSFSFPKVPVVSIYKIGMAVVIFFHNGSDKELGTHTLSKGTKGKVKKLALLCFLLQ